jgi:subtilisin family serine protease
MKHLSFFLFLLLPISLFAQHKLLTAENGDNYLAGVINLKVDDAYRSVCTKDAIGIPELIRTFEELEFKSVQKKFKSAEAPAHEFNERGLKTADISLIYELHVSEDVDVIEASKTLQRLESVVYAEPQFVSYDMYTPNDANLNSVMPYHYDNINAYEAWDISLGDTNVVIGITETAINVDHPEFVGNIKYNYDDPVGNGDDDNDSYTDNFAGWDVVENDNVLTEPTGTEIHGDAVSAISSAAADNGIGYAGVGFKCKFIPVKVANNNQVITHGYEGIEYAIEQGASVVNCSWGNTSFSQVAQDVVTWAAVNNDVVLISSAGNATSTTMYYPASYNYVLSVTGVDQNDLFDNGSNPPFTYNDSVDVSAPGINIYTTAKFQGQILYAPPQGGTSMAAPIVAGLAGLVRSHYPCLDALEVIERIKATANNIDGLPQNSPYAGQIGTGRINAEAALTGELCDPVGITENQPTYVEVYPNPSTNEVNIRMSRSDNWNVQVFDTKGRVVINRQVIGIKLVLNGLSSGFYIARVSSNRGVFSRRFSIIEQ